MERRAARRVAMVIGVALCCLAAGAGAAAARTTANPCTELPAGARSVCEGPDVHCTVKEDAHKRWETVFGIESTMVKAQGIKKRALALGYGPVGIEADVRCSNGHGVYEVAQNRFRSFAGAAALARQARSHGLSGARTEDS
jgi:hypothetical protein